MIQIRTVVDDRRAVLILNGRKWDRCPVSTADNHVYRNGDLFFNLYCFATWGLVLGLTGTQRTAGVYGYLPEADLELMLETAFTRLEAGLVDSKEAIIRQQAEIAHSTKILTDFRESPCLP